MIAYQCPSCRKPMESSESLAGQSDRCPSCGASVCVPMAYLSARPGAGPSATAPSPPTAPSPAPSAPPLPAAWPTASIYDAPPPPPIPQHALRKARETWLTKQSTGLVAAGIFLLIGIGVVAWGYYRTGVSKDSRDITIGLGVILVYATLVALIGGIPGMIARHRKAKNYAAINVLGYVGMFVLGLPWLAALIWALADSKEAG